jgi:SAM-dependent methyltransferase
MEHAPNWASLWRQLVDIKSQSRKSEGRREADMWSERAHRFDTDVKRRWARPDSSRDFILSQLDSDRTVLDIGAGTGAWSALLAGRVRRVTAVEPSSAMIEVMRRVLDAEAVSNVDIVHGSWPEAAVAPHDFSLCSHAMYGCADLPAFIRRMISCTRRMCFLLMRAATFDGVSAEAARHIWGHPFDSPNFLVAYNLLVEMGIYANVLMEDTGLWTPRISAGLDDAFNRMKRHFGLNGTEHDEYLRDLLKRRLTLQNGEYVWPAEIRSALVYWTIEDVG